MLRSMLPAAQLSDDGRTAVLSIPLAALPRVSATGAVRRARGLSPRSALDMAQRLNGSFNLLAGKKLLPGETDTTTPNQAWKLFTWTYQTSGAGHRLGRCASRGSVRSASTRWSSVPADNLWQITGSLYASN